MPLSCDLTCTPTSDSMSLFPAFFPFHKKSLNALATNVGGSSGIRHLCVLQRFQALVSIWM